jgi:hypothetical protein
VRRRAAKIDANQGEIVKALRAIGCSVVSLAPLGNGCPDLLVGIFRRNLLLEVKDGDKSESRRKLTPMEREFHETWKGKVETVHNVDEAIQAVTYPPYNERK